MTHSVEQGTTERFATIKEKIHFYVGSDSMSDCWSDVLPLLEALATQPTEAPARVQELATYVALRLPERIPLRGDRNKAAEVISRLLTEAGAPTEARPLDEFDDEITQRDGVLTLKDRLFSMFSADKFKRGDKVRISIWSRQ